MDGYRGFAVILARLMYFRQMDAVSLSAISGIPEADLHQLLSGEPPLPSHLHNLSSAFGLHAADIYVFANVPVPEVLAPQDPAAEPAVVRLIAITMTLPPELRTHVHRLVEEAPQESRGAFEPQRSYDPEAAGYGALLINLCGNRNLHSLPAIAKTLAMLTEERVYLASTTISAIGRGRTPVTSKLIAGFATILGVSTHTLAAIIGFESADLTLAPDPLTAELSDLLWKCRRLTAAQVESVYGEARAILASKSDGSAATR